MAPRSHSGAAANPHTIAPQPGYRARSHRLAIQEAPQIGHHISHGGIAVCRVKTDTLVDDGTQLALAAKLGQRVITDAVDKLARFRFAEGGAVADQLVERDTQAVLVARKRVLALHQSLGRHIAQRAIVALGHQRGCLAIVQHSSQSEIAHVQHPIVIKQQVAGLHIAV